MLGISLRQLSYLCLFTEILFVIKISLQIDFHPPFMKGNIIGGVYWIIISGKKQMLRIHIAILHETKKVKKKK